MMGATVRSTRRIAAGVAVVVMMALAACTPPVDGGGTTTTESTTTTTESTTTTTAPVDPHAVDGVQLTWGYNRYSQYGVFGAWSHEVEGAGVSLETANGQVASGDPADAARSFTSVRFDGGTGSIDPSTGAGTVSWDTGTWTMNPYNGLYGAPDESFTDPQLTIAPDDSGTLSFEVFVAAALDMAGNPVPAAGPARVPIATFSSVSLSEGRLSATPDFAGRMFTSVHPDVLPNLDCDGTGGSWPAEYISMVPASIQAHYYTTSCSGLNAMKPPLPFSVSWTPSAPQITLQPVAPTASVPASGNLDLSVGATGNPAPTLRWQRSFDGTTWGDIEGAASTGFRYPHGAAVSDQGAVFRVVATNGVGEDAVSDVVGPLTVTTAPTAVTTAPVAQTVGRGEPATFRVIATGAPLPEVQWQRSDDAGASWQDVATTTETYATAATPTVNSAISWNTAQSDHGAQFRAVLDNGYGTPTEIVTAPVTLSVVFAAPTFSLQPKPRIAFVGQDTITFSANVAGLPTVSCRWQHSADGGVTWTDFSSQPLAGTTPPNPAYYEGTHCQNLWIGTVTAEMDGLMRLRASNTAATVYSDAVTFDLHVPSGVPEIKVLTIPGAIDRSQGTSLQIIGAGFTPPADVADGIRVVVTSSAAWQPGSPGNTVGSLRNLLVSRTSLVNGNGFFTRDTTVAANGFAAGVDYGAGTFATTAPQRIYDTWLPLPFAN